MGAPVVHFEIGCRNQQATVDFYSKLLGWNVQTYGGAAMIDTGHPPMSPGMISGHIQALGHEPHNYVTVYAAVDDLEATLKHAESLGGRTIVPPTEVPGMGHFAWFADPEGTCMGLWKSTTQT